MFSDPFLRTRRFIPRSKERDAARKREEFSAAAQKQADEKQDLRAKTAAKRITQAEELRYPSRPRQNAEAVAKRDLQAGVLPTNNAEMMRLKRKQERTERDRSKGDGRCLLGTCSNTRRAGCCAGANKTQRAQARIAVLIRHFHEILAAAAARDAAELAPLQTRGNVQYFRPSRSMQTTEKEKRKEKEKKRQMRAAARFCIHDAHLAQGIAAAARCSPLSRPCCGLTSALLHSCTESSETLSAGARAKA
jgi:hypothetical protein